MSEVIDRLNAALEGHYRIERELGAGGMATVYLAQDLRHGRHVAVKVFRPEVAGILGGERFLREIEIVAGIEHPHILTLIDSGNADGLLYFVMPYVRGDSLRTRLAQEERLPIADVVRLMRDVADGLAEAHRHGLVHRDIKPDNIMMSGKHAVVMDFGVAKAVSSATGQHSMTTAGMTLGTPAYMSPEQAAAEPDIDHRTDIYALGVLAYELLTGRPPLTGSSAAQILAAHISTEPDPVSTHRVETPPALQAVVMKCLAKEPKDRWQHTEEVVQHLESIATPSGGVPSLQLPGSVKRKQAARPWRRWIAIGGAAVVLLGLALAQQQRAASLSALVAELDAAVEAGDLDRVDALLRDSGRDFGERAFEPIAAAAGATVSVVTVPAGATVELTRVSADLATLAPPVTLGRTPLVDVRLVAGEYLATASAQDHQTVEFSILLEVGESVSLDQTLIPEAWNVPGMVYVGGGPVPGPLSQDFPDVVVEPFLIDRFEVSNQRFMGFVAEGGYRETRLWPESMYLDGTWVSRDVALSAFVDRTGLPGPRGWSGGTFPDGRGDYPVFGVNWYEAAAFAAWSGSELPSFGQWWRAALGDRSNRFPWGDDLRSIDQRSNFGGVGTTPVGSFTHGASPHGVFDMAGNVKEWISGDPPDSLFTVLGGSWLTPTYMFDSPNLESFPPLFDSEEVGFRLARPLPNR